MSVWARDTNIPGKPRGSEVKVCCADFASALQRGTDNQGYGALIYALDDKHWALGAGSLDRLFYCPWCGELALIEDVKKPGA